HCTSTAKTHTQDHPPPPTGYFIFLTLPSPATATLFPYTTLFRSRQRADRQRADGDSLSDPGGDFRPCVSPRATEHKAGNHRQDRSEEHTSELQSRFDLVCRLLLEKKNTDDMVVWLSLFLYFTRYS